MRTKVLLIICTYYITFIVIATLLSLVRVDLNLALLSYMPVLFLVHGNITDAVLLLILFSNSIIAIITFTWIWMLVPEDYIFNEFIIIFYIFKPPIYIGSYIKGIFHPPILFLL